TADQKKELEALQKMVDEKLTKILSEDQQKQLKEMGERGPGGFGRPGGGLPGGRPGAGNPPPKKDN
ncbi:MAG: EF-hand domain-containing protein, partial [Gemmataceae bacterium]|nr:EF-hand domain-containing protein [Gemmataceae bacterium]